MNDMIVIPTVEQINIEHQLANSKASEAVQHATNCGLMLLQVKASLNHGEWLPWLNGEIEAGRLEVKRSQANTYMRVASNYQRAGNLEGVTSIRAALELLSDKEPEAEAQGKLIDLEAERQAREAAEAKAEAERQSRELFERRAQESQAESNERRKKIRDLETEIDKLKEQSIEIKEIEKIPDDYEATKNKVELLQKKLDELIKQQDKIIKDQVIAKLNERQQELNKLERDKQDLESVIARHKSNLESLSSEVRRIEAHRGVIEKQRLVLIDLASFISGVDSIEDNETRDMWLRLSRMLHDGSNAILDYLGMLTKENAMEKFNE